ATGWTKVGHSTKEGIPWATATALEAVSLAAHGHRGPVDILDNPDDFDHARLFAPLRDHWAVSTIYFKRYSCCRWAHSAIDASLILQKRHDFKADAIQAIQVETFERALTLP